LTSTASWRLEVLSAEKPWALAHWSASAADGRAVD
jgi:hypothetical protein